MTAARELLAKAVYIGGVPRSGTTFLARALNSHPDFVVSADDHVLESWGLYYYRSRVGIVDGLRRGVISGEEALGALERHHFRDGWLLRAVPSQKTEAFRPSAPPLRPDGAVLEGDAGLDRRDVPLQAFAAGWRLALKSPEITYVLRDLAELLPKARFVLVYRPLAEVAESMYRMGERVKQVKIFHRRWRDERGDDGRLIPPPGVPAEWAELWDRVTDFQRCVINGASYMKALAEKAASLSSSRVFLYSYADLKSNPKGAFAALAGFLNSQFSGFQNAVEEVRQPEYVPSSKMSESYDLIRGQLGIEDIERLLSRHGS